MSNFILRLLSYPMRFLAIIIGIVAKIVFKIRVYRYDPEKLLCPACKFRGCRVNFIRTLGTEKAALQHSCIRCSAVFYSSCAVPPEKWLDKVAR